MSTSLWVCLKIGCPKIWRIIINVPLKQIDIWGVYPIVRHSTAQALDATETPVREINENQRGQRSNEQWSVLVGFTGSICGKTWFFQRTSRVFSRFSRESGNWDTIYQSYSLSVYLFVCLFVCHLYLSICLFVCLSACLHLLICLAACLTVYLSNLAYLIQSTYLSLSVCPSICLSIHLSVCRFFRPSIHPSIPFVHPFVYLATSNQIKSNLICCNLIQSSLAQSKSKQIKF